MDLSFGASPLTVGEISAMVDASDAAGVLVDIPGKTLARYVITQDIIANGGPEQGIPAQVLDRVGADHLTRVGGLQVAGAGLTGFATNANYIATASTALAGANEFWAGVLIRPNVGTGVRVPFGFSDHNTGGWYIFLANNYLSARAYDAVDLKYSIDFNINARLGTLIDARLRISGGFLQLFVDGAPHGTAVAIGAFVPKAGGRLVFGATNGGSLYGATNVDMFGGGGGVFTVSNAEVLAAATASLASGAFVSVPSKTTRSYEFAQDLTDSGGKVPVIVRDRIAGTDHMAVVNNKLEVAQRTERLWGWEAA
jgi:hypothetical protein